MAYAVSLLFNAEMADAVSARWQRLADAGFSRSMVDLGYHPHLTLAVYDELAVEAASAALDRVFDNVERIPVTLTGFSTFGAGSGVCYAALASSPDLVRLHATIVTAIGETCRPHYQAGRWTPHCTLATGMTDVEIDHARNLLAKDWRSLAGTFEMADLVEFAPVAGIKRWPLALTPRSTRTS
ncbi:2'-5' RNA ligase [Bradyrhizobium sp. AZCC 1678]|uniref:2'-5' RNA ligase family protein n=1 Tax=Bradyrhizobium sp. AZCC 1678 TaxID=3117030 RepID=UPI002FF0C5C9